MENLIEVCIPILSDYKSKKHSKKIFRATEKFLKSSSHDVVPLNILKSLIKKHQNNLFNPEKCMSTIEDIFLELDYFFGESSWIYCNSLKRLMSLAAFEFGELESDCYGDYVVIDDLNNWLDCVSMIIKVISESDGIYFVNYNNEKHYSFCLGTKNSEMGFLLSTDIMTSEIVDYWI
jgi:hypothetical protein